MLKLGLLHMLPKNLVLILRGCFDPEKSAWSYFHQGVSNQPTYSGLSTLLQPLDTGTPSHDAQIRSLIVQELQVLGDFISARPASCVFADRQILLLSLITAHS